MMFLHHVLAEIPCSNMVFNSLAVIEQIYNEQNVNCMCLKTECYRSFVSLTLYVNVVQDSVFGLASHLTRAVVSRDGIVPVSKQAFLHFLKVIHDASRKLLLVSFLLGFRPHCQGAASTHH